MPILHAVAVGLAAPWRIRRQVRGRVLAALLGPALLDFLLVHAVQQLRDTVADAVGDEVADKLEAVGVVRHPRDLRRRGSGVAVGVASVSDGGGDADTAFLLDLELLVRPLLLRGHAERVEVVRQALVGLPGRPGQGVAAVLGRGVVYPVVGGAPLDQVEVLVQAALRVQEGLPRRQVLHQGLDAVPGVLGLALRRQRLVDLAQRLPPVRADPPLAVDEAGPRHRDVEQTLPHVEVAAEPVLELRPLRLEELLDLLEPGDLLRARAGDPVQDQEPLVPQQHLAHGDLVGSREVPDLRAGAADLREHGRAEPRAPRAPALGDPLLVRLAAGRELRGVPQARAVDRPPDPAPLAGLHPADTGLRVPGGALHRGPSAAGRLSLDHRLWVMPSPRFSLEAVGPAARSQHA
mmetsp:Transcript_52610/g.148188  ORF Transcript_52610/g.148188 Transcript_52610/m.148188 type:complete len:406 (+) Transcript_52610:592-1809(+)